MKIDLTDYIVKIEMVRRVDSAPEAVRPDTGRERATFTARVPCLDQRHAEEAAEQFGLLVNDASGGAWKLTDNITVTAVTPTT